MFVYQPLSAIGNQQIIQLLQLIHNQQDGASGIQLTDLQLIQQQLVHAKLRETLLLAQHLLQLLLDIALGKNKVKNSSLRNSAIQLKSLEPKLLKLNGLYASRNQLLIAQLLNAPSITELK